MKEKLPTSTGFIAGFLNHQQQLNRNAVFFLNINFVVFSHLRWIWTTGDPWHRHHVVDHEPQVLLLKSQSRSLKINLQKWNHQHLFSKHFLNMYSNLKFWNLQLFSSVPKKRKFYEFRPSVRILAGTSGWSKFDLQVLGGITWLWTTFGVDFALGILPWNSIMPCWLMIGVKKIPNNLMIGPDPPTLDLSLNLCWNTFHLDFSWTENTDVNKMFCWTLIDFPQSHL